MKIIRLIRLLTTRVIANSITEIGLCSVANGSELRWSESPVQGYAPLITAIGDITTKLDLGNGGNIEQYSAMSFSIVNLNQMNLVFDDMDYPLINAIVICEDYYPDISQSKVVYVGIIDRYSADDVELSFECEAWEDKKNKNLTTKIIVGENGNYPMAPEGVKDQIIPLCFGESDPETGRYFKLPCTKNVYKTLTQQNILDLVNAPEQENIPAFLDEFPVFEETTTDYTYWVKLGKVDLQNVNMNNLVNKYIYASKCPINTDINPNNENSDEGRISKILSVWVREGYESGENAMIGITIEDQINLYGNEYSNHKYQSYIQFVDKGISATELELYRWETGSENMGFCTEPKIYLGDNRKSCLHGKDSLKLITNHNSIGVRKTYEEPEENKFVGYKIVTLPGLITPINDIVTLSKYNDPIFHDDGEEWDLSQFLRTGNYGHYINGITQGITLTTTISSISMDPDPDNRDIHKFQYYSTTEHEWEQAHKINIRAFRFPLPEINFDFNECYIGIDTTCLCDFSNAPVLGLQKYLGVADWAIENLGQFDKIFTLNNLPDWFYDNSTKTGNKDFFDNNGIKDTTSGNFTRYTGFKNYLVENCDSVEKYRQYKEGLLFFPRHYEAGTHIFTEVMSIRKLCLIFRTNVDMGDYLYV